MHFDKLSWAEWSLVTNQIPPISPLCFLCRTKQRGRWWMCVQLWSSLTGQRLWLRSNGNPASQRPAAWPLHHHHPPKPLPPMAGKGTEGRGETAEKTRHTRVRPLNANVTVKGPENLRSLLEWYICLAVPGSVRLPCIHEEGMHTFILELTLTMACRYIDTGYYRLNWSTHTLTAA